jgi:Putative DNA-binding domain
MTLLELQRRMSEAVMLPLTRTDTMQRRTRDGRSMKVEAAAFIKPNNRLTSFERLEIYNRQYWFRIISAFAEDFPGLAAVVGPAAFDKLTRAYLADCPSQSFTLRNLGSQLESWLSEHPEHAGKKPELALDVVCLEWAYIEAFDNAAERALTLADLGQLDGESQLSLQPHLRLLQLLHAVDDFVIDVHRQQASQTVASNAVTGAKRSRSRRLPASLKRGEVFLGVHRYENAVYYKRLEREEYQLLRALDTDKTLGEALDQAFLSSSLPEDERPARVQAWFANWAELGWFCRHKSAAARRLARKRIN